MEAEDLHLQGVLAVDQVLVLVPVPCKAALLHSSAHQWVPALVQVAQAVCPCLCKAVLGQVDDQVLDPAQEAHQAGTAGLLQADHRHRGASHQVKALPRQDKDMAAHLLQVVGTVVHHRQAVSLQGLVDQEVAQVLDPLWSTVGHAQ